MINKRPRRSTGRAGRPQQAEKKWHWVTLVATLFALLVSVYSITLSLMEYGYDAVYLDEFGIPLEFMQRTPLDYLIRSYKPFLGMLPKLNELMNLSKVIETVWNDFLVSGVLEGLVRAGIPIPFGVWAYCAWPGTLRPLVRKIIVETAWFEKLFSPVQRMAHAVKSRIVIPRLLGWFGWLILPTAVPAAVILVCVLCAIVIALLQLPLIFGLHPGITYGEKDAKAVKQASRCGKTRPDQGETLCVRILKGKDEIARGRLIDIGGGRIYIYPLAAVPSGKTTDNSKQATRSQSKQGGGKQAAMLSSSYPLNDYTFEFFVGEMATAPRTVARPGNRKLP